MTEALPNLHLPFAAANPAPTLMTMNRAVFEGGYSDSTSDLVDADVADGNRGFALHGDVTNALDYHLWSLALVMGTEYKARPMHAPLAYDVPAMYRLRKVGQIPPPRPPAADSAATTARYAEVKLLERAAVQQMCDMVIPGRGSHGEGGNARYSPALLRNSTSPFSHHACHGHCTISIENPPFLHLKSTVAFLLVLKHNTGLVLAVFCCSSCFAKTSAPFLAPPRRLVGF